MVETRGPADLAKMVARRLHTLGVKRSESTGNARGVGAELYQATAPSPADLDRVAETLAEKISGRRLMSAPGIAETLASAVGAWDGLEVRCLVAPNFHAGRTQFLFHCRCAT